METTGTLRIFERSRATRGLKYKDMLGDGDSSTYSAILESKPYGEDCIPSKLECIGHVQKRVETDCGNSIIFSRKERTVCVDIKEIPKLTNIRRVFQSPLVSWLTQLC